MNKVISKSNYASKFREITKSEDGSFHIEGLNYSGNNEDEAFKRMLEMSVFDNEEANNLY
jgi:hypothetical protein